jgi:hypothetical protein
MGESGDDGLRGRYRGGMWGLPDLAGRSDTLNTTLRTYAEERLQGVVLPEYPIPGPAVPWKGRRHGRRK